MEFQFDSMSDWFEMAGHGPYVWFCYALALFVVLANWLWVRRSRRLFLRDANARLIRMHTRKSQPQSSEQQAGNP
ncbi:MAG: heme exporter protein CcmD [Pseudomonadales bacterium]